eukprot:2388786-Rhodomonas_salina.3
MLLRHIRYAPSVCRYQLRPHCYAKCSTGLAYGATVSLCVAVAYATTAWLCFTGLAYAATAPRCDAWYWASVCRYCSAMRCPVLRSGMGLCEVRYWDRVCAGTEMGCGAVGGYGDATCSGCQSKRAGTRTGVAYGPTRVLYGVRY